MALDFEGSSESARIEGNACHPHETRMLNTIAITPVPSAFVILLGYGRDAATFLSPLTGRCSFAGTDAMKRCGLDHYSRHPREQEQPRLLLMDIGEV
jgi:hypothetical protein